MTVVVLRARRKPAPPVEPKPEVRCDFTELFPSQCAHCLGIDASDWLPEKKVTLYEGA